MKIRKCRYVLCYVNRVLEEVDVYFYDINEILEFIDKFGSIILYIKSCYDFKEHKCLYNYLFINRKG